MGDSSRGEQFSMRRQAVDQHIEMILSYLVAEGIEDLEKIIEARPELRQFVTQTTYFRALQAIQNLDKTLKKYPRLFEELAAAVKANPHRVVMAILPEENLVFTQTPEGVEGFAPVLTCTHYAMDDVYSDFQALGESYGIITSNNGLIPYVIEQLEYDARPVISYSRRQMKPEDYIALGAQGIFANETFRFRIKDGTIVR